METKEFTQSNLVEFEMEYSKIGHGKYHNLRYGQALENIFGLSKLAPHFADLFYEEDYSEARHKAWLLVSGRYESRSKIGE